jgi:hypothetical protein
MEDDRFSTQMHGDLAFAGSRESATVVDAGALMDAKARVRLEREVITTAEALRVLTAKKGSQESMDAAEQRYDAAVAAMLAFEAEMGSVSRESARASAEPVAADERISLASAFCLDAWGARRLDESEMEARLDAFVVLCRFCFEGGRIRNPWLAFKNFLAVVRRACPEMLDSISQTELALLLGETKASPSAREKKILEGLMKKFGMLGTHLLGGTKSDAARRKYSAAQRGNTNRRKGKGGKKGSAAGGVTGHGSRVRGQGSEDG